MPIQNAKARTVILIAKALDTNPEYLVGLKSIGEFWEYEQKQEKYREERKKRRKERRRKAYDEVKKELMKN